MAACTVPFCFQVLDSIAYIVLNLFQAICGLLRFSAKIFGFLRLNLRFSAVSCALQMLEFAGEGVNLQESAVFCEKICVLGSLYMSPYPVLPFLVFFGRRHGKPPKKQGFFIPTQSLKSLEKKGKTLEKNKQFLAEEKKKQGIPKKQGKEGLGSSVPLSAP